MPLQVLETAPRLVSWLTGTALHDADLFHKVKWWFRYPVRNYVATFLLSKENSRLGIDGNDAEDQQRRPRVSEQLSLGYKALRLWKCTRHCVYNEAVAALVVNLRGSLSRQVSQFITDGPYGAALSTGRMTRETWVGRDKCQVVIAQTLPTFYAKYPYIPPWRLHVG